MRARAGPQTPAPTMRMLRGGFKLAISTGIQVCRYEAVRKRLLKKKCWQKQKDVQFDPGHYDLISS
jgi:hypothetical protein